MEESWVLTLSILFVAFLILMLFSRSQMYSLTCSYKNSEGNVQFFFLIIKVMNYIDSVYNIEPFILLKQNPCGQSVLFFKSTLYSFCYFYLISLPLYMFCCIEVSKSKLRFLPFGIYCGLLYGYLYGAAFVNVPLTFEENIM